MKRARQPAKADVPTNVEKIAMRVTVPQVPGYLARLVRPVTSTWQEKAPATSANVPGRDGRLVKGKRP